MPDLITSAEATAAVPALANLDSGELAALISAASAGIENYLGYAVSAGTYTETLHPESTRILRLAKAAPITSISSIVYGRSATPLTDYGIVGDGSTGEIEVYRGFSHGFRYSDRPYGSDPRSGAVTVVYLAGFVVAAVPPDLKRAAILTLVALRDAAKASGYFQSERLGDYAYTLAAQPTGVPAAAMALIQSRRRKRFA